MINGQPQAELDDILPSSAASSVVTVTASGSVEMARSGLQGVVMEESGGFSRDKNAIPLVKNFS